MYVCQRMRYDAIHANHAPLHMPMHPRVNPSTDTVCRGRGDRIGAIGVWNLSITEAV